MLTISGDQFLLDEQPFRIFSGAVHYFRVRPEYWRDRLEKARLFGLNTVETYIAWNLHEPHPGEFHFERDLDLVRFIKTAADLGLKVILRPGPYICSEWDFGGLPAWLLKDPRMQVRCMYPPYLAAVDRYFDALLPRLAGLQASHGGPIIAFQVENEYGSYGNDHAYLLHLVNGLRSRGIDSLLFTSDNVEEPHLQNGSLPVLHKTINFAYGARPALTKLRKHQPSGPLMVTEFWSGWFDHWGERHNINAGGLPTFFSSLNLRTVLAAGASINFYMFHGGTSFGFMSGANVDRNRFRSDVSSYDYGAPLDECGDPTQKFFTFHKLLKRARPELPIVTDIPAAPKRSFGRVDMDGSTALMSALPDLSTKYLRPAPEPMEFFDQNYGFILYRTHLSGPVRNAPLKIDGLHDRAQVFLEDQPVGILEREFPNRKLRLDVPPVGARLDILVENMGRLNYGPQLTDRKGITGLVTLSNQALFNWEIYPLPLEDLTPLRFTSRQDIASPGFFRGTFTVDIPVDTWLTLAGWTKGVAWLNGFNLGRYWSRGPQRSLYVPAPLLQQGVNEIIVLELHGCRSYSVELLDHPITRSFLSFNQGNSP